MGKKSLIESRISSFIRELESSSLNTEQRKIYNAFTKNGGSKVSVSVVDCEGVRMKVSLSPTEEVRKILTKHYKTTDGTVTAKEIVNMFDIVRTGSKYFSQGNYVYWKELYRDGRKYKTIIKIFRNGSSAVLKSFYSNMGYEK